MGTPLEMSYRRSIYLCTVGALLLLFDILSKWYIAHFLFTHSSYMEWGSASIPLFRNLGGIDFWIRLTTNTGAAWGVCAHYPLLLLFVRFCIIIGILLYLIFFLEDRAMTLPFIIILTGAVGNVLDFFIYGSVVDFLHLRLWGYDFPIFNIADICITVGIAWLFILGCRPNKQRASDA